MMNRFFLLTVSFLFFLLSCHDDPNPGTELYPEAGEELLGGTTTVFISGFNAFELKIPGMNTQHQNEFALGNSFFEQNWVTAPASTGARDGLGPFFNAKACSSCHFKDGRGRPPYSSTENEHGLLIQLGVYGVGENGGPIGHPIYGGQFQDQAIMGLEPQGRVKITYQPINGSYPDGQTYTLNKPIYNFINLAYGSLDDALFSPRVAPQMIGLGLLDAIPAESIIAAADENDSDGDGISGKAIYVWDNQANAMRLGRYGWKASVPTVKQQAATAFSFDMGLTTPLFPNERCPQGVVCDDIPNGGEPEVPMNRLDQVTTYSKTLAVPVRRNYKDQNVLRGKQLFTQLDCAKCHTTTQYTGAYDIAPIANQTIHPYTDMLLHDMGEELSDNRPVFGANGNEWRTPPLWGIGLFQEVNGHTFYMHDGRARNLEEAILWHGGEASNSVELFKNLTAEKRQDVLDFLNSL